MCRKKPELKMGEPVKCQFGRVLNCQRCQEYRYAGLGYCRLRNPEIWDKKQEDNKK